MLSCMVIDCSLSKVHPHVREREPLLEDGERKSEREDERCGGQRLQQQNLSGPDSALCVPILIYQLILYI